MTLSYHYIVNLTDGCIDNPAYNYFHSVYHLFISGSQVQVFDPTDADDAASETLFVGSRPHESEEAFLHFLDILYAVCFHKTLDAEREHGPCKPYLLPYSSQVGFSNTSRYS